MNGFTENTTSGASEKPSRRDVVLTWDTACRMLPLVRHIVGDIVSRWQHLAQVQLEKERLDRHKRTLTWPERSRRYQLQEETAAGEKHLHEALTELQGLGVALFSPAQGLIGFPTRVNERPAFFSWQPGEESLQFWHFEEGSERLPIPVHWMKPSGVRLRSKS